jgi:predicted acyl esterase
VGSRTGGIVSGGASPRRGARRSAGERAGKVRLGPVEAKGGSRAWGPCVPAGPLACPSVSGRVAGARGERDVTSGGAGEGGGEMAEREERKATDPSEVVSGTNRIVVRTAHFGLQPMILEKDVAVPMRDGTVLYANVFRPEAEGRYPVILSADVYGKDSHHKGFAARTLGSMLGAYEVSDFTAWEAPDPGFWVPNGYVVVKLALRGTSGSVGHISMMSDQEARDFYDAIEWAAEQPWSSGAVGTNGVSYLAMTQWKVAQLQPPHLKAMIPWEGRNDMYRERAFHGGIPETNFARFIVSTLSHRGLTPGSTVEDLARVQAEHPLWDEYWAERHGDLSKITVPMYVGASWSTQGVHTRGTLEGFRQASSEKKWLEIHGRKEWETYYSRERLERQRRFFDFFLKGEANGWEDTPPVRIEVRERFYEGTTRFEWEWPLLRTRYTPLYLDARTGGMGLDPVAVEGAVSYDARDGESDAGAAKFRFVFTSETELTGYMKLRLWVSTDAGDDMDLFVGVHKLDRRGREVYFADFNHIENGRVASGWLRVSHRELDEERSTPYQPWLKHRRLQKLAVGEIVPVEIEILPSSTLFRAGESLLVQVRGTEIPLDPVMGVPREQYAQRYAHAETVNQGHHTLHTGGRYDAHLLVPVIPPR